MCSSVTFETPACLHCWLPENYKTEAAKGISSWDNLIFGQSWHFCTPVRPQVFYPLHGTQPNKAFWTSSYIGTYQDPPKQAASVLQRYMYLYRYIIQVQTICGDKCFHLNRSSLDYLNIWMRVTRPGICPCDSATVSTRMAWTNRSGLTILISRTRSRVVWEDSFTLYSTISLGGPT